MFCVSHKHVLRQSNRRAGPDCLVNRQFRGATNRYAYGDVASSYYDSVYLVTLVNGSACAVTRPRTAAIAFQADE